MDLSDITDILLKYGYPIIFLLSVYEGPFVTITASFLAASGFFSILLIYPIVVLADLIGDVIWYYVGYFGRKKIINRWGKFLGLPYTRLDRIERLNERFKRHQGKIMFGAKITHVLGFPFLIAAGVLKWDIKKFIWFNFLGALPKSLLWVIIGYFFGHVSVLVIKYFKYGTYISIGILIFSLVVYLLIIRISQKYFKRFKV